MGQYYRAYVKKANVPIIIDPYTYSSGSKLMEHSWLGDRFTNVVYSLIERSPSVIGWIGDYSNEVNCPNSVYQCAWRQEAESGLCCPQEIDSPNYFRDEATGNVVRQGKGYLLNHNRKEYLDLDKYAYMAMDNGWVIDPLPLLTAIGNGLGGGDYHNGLNKDMVGRWFVEQIEYLRCDELDDRYNNYSNITEDTVFME